MQINKFLPIALVYFFVNALGLPFGLTYTALLSPLFYWWIVKTKQEDILLPLLFFLSPFILLQWMMGVDARSYIVSLVNYTSVYIFCRAFYLFLEKCNDPEKIFRKIFILNFLFCLLAIPIYFSGYNESLWMQSALTDAKDHFSRLKLFTYEPSYYAVLFTPLFFFYFLQLILNQNKTNSWILLAMLLLPYLLSFSVGVISSVLFAIMLTGIIYFRQLIVKKRVLNLSLLAGSSLITALMVLEIFFPANTLFLRLSDIISGNDVSGNGRTSDAFFLAKQIMQQKSSLWGIGPGQIKILGTGIIKEFYMYPVEYNNIAIPNAAAETLAIFGWTGFIIRIAAELFLFIHTRVWTNYYRLLLFLFMFLYQFTGSFITNITEYVIWILAFTNAFTAFDIVKRKVPAPYTLQHEAIC